MAVCLSLFFAVCAYTHHYARSDGKVRNTIEFATDAATRCCAACRVPGWLTEQAECSGWRLIPTTPGAFNSSGNSIFTHRRTRNNHVLCFWTFYIIETLCCVWVCVNMNRQLHALLRRDAYDAYGVILHCGDKAHSAEPPGTSYILAHGSGHNVLIACVTSNFQLSLCADHCLCLACMP